jgi:hypothetical protein
LEAEEEVFNPFVGPCAVTARRRLKDVTTFVGHADALIPQAIKIKRRSFFTPEVNHGIGLLTTGL